MLPCYTHRFCFQCLTLIVCLLSTTSAQTTLSTNLPSAPTVTTAVSLFTTSYISQPTFVYPAGGADGPGTVANAGPTTVAGQNAEGAAGGSSGGFNISVGGLVAIGIIVGLVVVVAVVSSIFFVVAKRRQWAIRDSVRASFRARKLIASYKQPTSSKIDPREKPDRPQISTPLVSKREAMRIGVAEEARNSDEGDIEKTGDNFGII